MRGAFGYCKPAFFVDGSQIAGGLVEMDDIDSWLRPLDIAGIEIYTAVGIPPQYQSPLSGCGSVVIWTK